MRLLRCPFICSQIEVTGRDKPVVTQDVLDMPDGTAIKKESRRHGVPQHVRGHGFRKADHFSKATEPGECRAESEGSTVPADHKERLSRILAPGHILFDPVERPRAEKEHSLLIAL